MLIVLHVYWFQSRENDHCLSIMTLCSLLHYKFSACNLRRKYSVDVFKLSSLRLLIEEAFFQNTGEILWAVMLYKFCISSLCSQIWTSKKKKKKVPKQCDLMSVGINLFLWWMSHFGMRLCKLFSEKIMNRHPTLGRKNNLRKPGSHWPVMNQHYPSGAANYWEISGKSWKGDIHHIFLLWGEHGNQVEHARVVQQNKVQQCRLFWPSVPITISLWAVLILRLQELDLD